MTLSHSTSPSSRVSTAQDNRLDEVSPDDALGADAVDVDDMRADSVRHADESTDPEERRRAEQYRRAAAEHAGEAADSSVSSAPAGAAGKTGGVNVGVQGIKILAGLAVMIGGLLYIKHVDMPQADMAYVAIMMVFLLLMMIGGGLLASGVQTIVNAAKS